MIHTLLLTSSVLILGIFCVRKLTFGWISMRARYALWLLAALRLLFPFSLGESPISVMNVFPAALSEIRQLQTGAQENGVSQTDFPLESGAGPYLEIRGETVGFERIDGSHNGGEDAVPETGKEVHGAPGQSVSAKEHFHFLQLLLGVVWLVGFLLVGSYMLFSRQRFVRYLKRNRSELADHTIPKAFAARLLARAMRVYQVQGLPSPCLVGKDIYLGSGAADDPQSIPHILAHEYSHALHWDGAWAFLRCFLAAVYWFDPFVWAAVYAARQDSELACDETAVLLLGESERFAYGRTLLNLLENGDDKETCPGMAFMLNRGEKGVRERIGALAACGRKRRIVTALVVLAALFFCGCAFTGAAQGDADSVTEKTAADAESGENADVQDAAAVGQGGKVAGDTKESAEFGKTSENAEKLAEVSEETKTAFEDEADQAAFEEMLQYHGVMEGRDDSELSLKRRVDYQAYYQYTRGEAENPMVNGWYLLCQNEDVGISLYGLYTEEFGFRGLKTLIGEDVNTFDGKWCASPMNISDDDIRVLELAQDGLPRRFVWKLLAQESGTTEIWRFYSAYRYDTGTVDVKTLTEEDCLAWAKEHLTFTVDQEAAEVNVICDGDMDLGAIDISAYADWVTEEVQIVPDTVGFVLDDPGADIYQAYSDAVWEKTAVHLLVGLKFADREGLWFDGLHCLTVQIAEDEKSASGFRLNHPRIDETFVGRALWQERELAGLRDDLEKPLVNEGAGHHDLAIDFSNPCPGYKYISVWYGEGIDPATNQPRAHTGVDMAADEGTDILAAAEGEVFLTGFDAEMGNYVVLWHVQSGQMTYYAHCKTVEVEKGQQVAQGEKIATVGQTGRATGPCLHFAISSENNWEEPYFLELE